jgi:hypothetical protein
MTPYRHTIPVCITLPEEACAPAPARVRVQARRRRGDIIAMLLIGAFIAVGGACSPAQSANAKKDANLVLDLTQTLCVIANSFAPESDVASVCNITGPLLGPMHDVLASTRTQTSKAAAEARAGVCAPSHGAHDAGSP